MNWICIGLLMAFSAAAQTPGDLAHSLNDEGNRLTEKGDFTEGERLYREAIAIWRSLGPAYEGHTAGSLLNLGVVLSAEDVARIDAAVPKGAAAGTRYPAGGMAGVFI